MSVWSVPPPRRPAHNFRTDATPHTPPNAVNAADTTDPASESAKMPFKRYVEIGRVALVNYGEDYGKLVVISDVVDQTRCVWAAFRRS